MSKAPKPLLVLLVIILLVRLLFALVSPGPVFLSLFPVAVFGFFAWWGIRGKESSAKVLAVLLLVGTAINLYQLSQVAAEEWYIAIIVLPIVLLESATAVYIFRSKALREFYDDYAVANRYRR